MRHHVREIEMVRMRVFVALYSTRTSLMILQSINVSYLIHGGIYGVSYSITDMVILEVKLFLSEVFDEVIISRYSFLRYSTR